MIRTISVLQRTRDSAHEGDQGCSLRSQLNKQIGRRQSELPAAVSREVSVIQCRGSSTPTHQSQSDCANNFSFGLSDQNLCSPAGASATGVPFKVYLDQPSEFYSLLPGDAHKTPVVSTDESDLNTSAVNEGERSVFEEEMAPSDGVKEAVVAKTTKFRRYIRLYDPARHEAEVLVSNKDTWMTTVDKGYTELLDFTEEVTAKPGVEANVIAEANRVVDEVELEFQKFLSDFNKKCSTVAAPPGGAAAALQPRVPQPGVPAPPPLSRGSTVQSVDVNAEKARLAAVEVEIDAEKVTDGVKSLKLEIMTKKSLCS